MVIYMLNLRDLFATCPIRADDSKIEEITKPLLPLLSSLPGGPTHHHLLSIGQPSNRPSALSDATPQTVSTVFPRGRTAVPNRSTGPFHTVLPDQSTNHPPGQLRPTHSPFQDGLASPPQIQLDRLGKLVCLAVEGLNDGLSFQVLCVRHRGASCLANSSDLPYPAAPLLQQLLETGAPVHKLDPAWSISDLDAAVRRGAHRSTHDHQEFLREEFADMTEAGQWLVLPYSLICSLPNLRLSPTGVVPQRNRRPRIIVDYSFYRIN
jgi:hypothetical protein